MSANGIVSDLSFLNHIPSGPWEEIKLGCLKFLLLYDIICNSFQLQVNNRERILSSMTNG